MSYSVLSTRASISLIQPVLAVLFVVLGPNKHQRSQSTIAIHFFLSKSVDGMASAAEEEPRSHEILVQNIEATPFGDLFFFLDCDASSWCAMLVASDLERVWELRADKMALQRHCEKMWRQFKWEEYFFKLKSAFVERRISVEEISGDILRLKMEYFVQEGIASENTFELKMVDRGKAKSRLKEMWLALKTGHLKDQEHAALKEVNDKISRLQAEISNNRSLLEKAAIELKNLEVQGADIDDKDTFTGKQTKRNSSRSLMHPNLPKKRARRGIIQLESAEKSSTSSRNSKSTSDKC